VQLVDGLGRSIRKLRVSLTDQCNLRCHYCMPEDATFMAKHIYLSPFELAEILTELKSLGLQEVRLTGGEPLLREDFSEILRLLSTLHFSKLALTTNGVLLHKYLDDLKLAKLHHLNISLDTFHEETFFTISRRKNLALILDNIHQAHAMGFHIKLNCVVMRGLNDHEIFDFIQFSEKYKIEVRFLELMKIGASQDIQSNQFISAREILGRIDQSYQLKAITQPVDSTSFNFLTDSGANIGFIASESQPFCNTCSRWRLSAEGILRSCLFKTEGLNLKNLSTQERMQAYMQVLAQKPVLRAESVPHYMHQIGG